MGRAVIFIFSWGSCLYTALFGLVLLHVYLCLFLLFLPTGCAAAEDSSPLVPTSPTTTVSSMYQRLCTSVRLSDVISCATFRRTVAKTRTVRQHGGSVVALVSFAGPSARRQLCILSVQRGELLFSSLISRKGGDKKGCTASFSGGIGSCGDSLKFFIARGACRNGGNCSLILGNLRGKVGSQTGRQTVMIRKTGCYDPSITISANHLKEDFNYPTLPPSLTGPVVGAVGSKALLCVCTGSGRCLDRDAVLSAKESVSPGSVVTLGDLVQR